MKFGLYAVLPLILVTSGVAALAQEADTGSIILDTSSFWRVHYTIKPPVVRKAGTIEAVQFYERPTVPVKWIMHDSPLPAAGWWKPDFDDSAWSRFPGVASGDFNVWGNPSGDRKSPFMALVCMRGKFKVTDCAKAGNLRLSVSYRGGIVVYLNGIEVASGHLPGRGPEQLALDYAEGEAHDRSLPDITIPAALLRKGTNVLAVEAHRTAYHEKDIRKVLKNKMWIAIDWGSCGLLSVRLRASGNDGIVPNIAKPGGVQVWNSKAMKVDCDLDYGDPNEKLGPIRIVGTRNGAFSGKVVVGRDQPIKGLRVHPSDLRHAEGKGVIPAAAVQARYAKPDHYQAGANQRYLVPAACFDSLAEVPPDEVPVRIKEPNSRKQNLVSPGVSPSFGAVQPVWVTVNVPADAAAGEYRGTLTISIEDDKPVVVPVALTVCGWKLPDPRDFVTWADIIQSPESVAMYYGVPLWSDAHFKYLDKSLKLLGEVGNKVAYVHLIAHTNAGNAQTMVRWIRQADGTTTYDLTPMEKYLDLVQKHLGKPPVVCFYVWDVYLEGGRKGGSVGPEKLAIRATHGDRGPLVSLLNEKTDEVETVALPQYSTPEQSAPLWGPLMKEIRKRMRKRGLEKSMTLGIATDNQPTKEVVDFFRTVAPGVPWISQAHLMPTNLHGVPVKYLGGVWGGGKFPKDPSVERTYGWKRTYTGRSAKEWSAPGGAVLVHMPRNYWMFFPVTSYRMLGEMNIAGSQRGFARLGADFWPVLKDRRGRSSWLVGRYPKSGWRNLDLRTTVLSPGPDGALSTHRFEMIREGIQECEARIFIEKAILEKKIGDELAARCQAILDARIPAMRRGVSRLADCAYLNPSWWQTPGVLGHEWYVGFSWQERSRQLFNAAHEVTQVLASRPRRLGKLDFEKDLKDPHDYLTAHFSAVWAGGVSSRANPVVTYVKGRTGLAARSSHNDTDDGGGDFGVRVGGETGPWTETNELYIRFWAKYEKGYRVPPGSRQWNVKWLWTRGRAAHNEVVLQNYDDEKGLLSAMWQLSGGGTGWEGGKRVSKWGTAGYKFGDWLKVEVYFKLSSGEGHLNPDGVQWLKLNGVKVIEGRDVVTGKPGAMSSPAIKSGDATPAEVDPARHSGECPAGHGWWQIDDYEVFDGLPRPDRPSPAAEGRRES